MTANLTITTERVDDIPVLLTQAEKIGVPDLLDSNFAPHGNWQGTSLGWTATVWLTHIISEGDHRLNHVQSWVADRLQALQICTGQPVRDLEWSDDRLEIVLDALSDATKWQAFERDLNRRTVRVYDLRPKHVRVDSTTASGYWTVTEDGLFQFGHSKDHRPDLPQLKVMMSALDPLGMPVVTQVVSGESADDPLYIPAVRQVSESLGEHGLLYVGDCKMAAIDTRAFIASQRDYYLCPLSEKQMPDDVLETYLKPVWEREQTTMPIERDDAAGQPEKIAEGYEQSVSLTHELNGQSVVWSERRLIVRSLQHAQASEAALRTRLAKAQIALARLNERKQGKERIGDRETMQAAAAAVLKRHRVAGLIKLTVEEQVQERAVRAYGNRPARIETKRDVRLQCACSALAVRSG